VRFTHAQEDVVRRDFTLNGLLLDPQLVEDGDVVRAQHGLVIDWVGGLEDLRTGRLRAIGDPLLRFGEDALRLLRAARFAARFDLQVDPETARAVRQQAATLMKVSVERITNEICLMLVAASAETGLRHLAELALAPVMWPELWAADQEMRLAQRRARGLALAQIERLQPQEGCLPPHGGLGLPLALASLCWPQAGWLGSVEAQRTLRLANADRSAAVGILELAHGALAKGLLARAPTPPPWPAALSRWLRNPLADQALLLLQAAEALATAADWREARARWPMDRAFPAAALSGSDLKALGFSAGPRFKLALAAAEDALLEGASADQARAAALALVSAAEP
jgi:poly(A) polymerase